MNTYNDKCFGYLNVEVCFVPVNMIEALVDYSALLSLPLSLSLSFSFLVCIQRIDNLDKNLDEAKKRMYTAGKTTTNMFDNKRKSRLKNS